MQLDDQQFTSISKALSDPKRYAMLQKIGSSEKAPTCSCLREWVELSPATVSHHLKELENAGLIEVKREGKFAHLTLKRDVWNAYLKRLTAI